MKKSGETANGDENDIIIQAAILSAVKRHPTEKLLPNFETASSLSTSAEDAAALPKANRIIARVAWLLENFLFNNVILKCVLGTDICRSVRAHVAVKMMCETSQSRTALIIVH